MRWLINYIRSCFCKHEWELLKQCNIYETGYEYPTSTRWIYRCKKCGMKNKVTTD